VSIKSASAYVIIFYSLSFKKKTLYGIVAFIVIRVHSFIKICVSDCSNRIWKKN